MRAIGRKSLSLLLTAVLVLSLVGNALAEPRPSGPSQSPFWDTIGTKFQTAVDSLYALQVVSGKSEVSFDPYGPVTRAEMAALVVRALGIQPTAPASAPFPDVPVNHWAAGVIARAAAEGIIKGGTDGYFRPSDPVTYPQVAAMLIRATGLESRAGVYPTGYAILANELGLIANTSWALDKNATRGDVALMLYQAVVHVKRGGSGPTLSQSVFKRAGSVVISPEAAVIPQAGARLTASALDWAGNPLDLPVIWSVTSGNANISTDGLLSPLNEQAVSVAAKVGGITASKTYTIVRSLSVKADSTTVKAGAQIRLSAVGVSGSGSEVPVTPVWSVVSGPGTVTAAGVLTIQGAQAVTVRATAGSLTAEKSFTPVGGISISPSQVTLAAGATAQFTATVLDSAGHAVTAPVTWAVSGGGSIDQTGNFLAGTTPATVTVGAGDQTATATVKIINRLEVSPSSGGTFRVGDAQIFSAAIYTSDNQLVPGQVTWRVEPTTIGFLGADGRFFAAAAGSGHVIATYGGLTTRVPIAVAGQATGLQLTATPTAMPANGNSKAVFTARLVDANGNTANGPESIMFAISNSKLGTLDKTIAPVENGTATATLTVGTASGTYMVYASAPGSNLPGASLTFVTTAPVISHVELEAYPNPLAADGISQTTVTAKLIDNSGSLMVNNTAGPITVSLNASNTAAGRLSSSLIQIAAGKSSGTVQFTASGAPGTTIITGTSTYVVHPVTVSSRTVGEAHRLKIRTQETTAAANGSAEVLVYVEVQDINGNVRTGDNTALIGLSASNGSYSIPIPSQQSRWGVATFSLRTTKAGTYSLNTWAVTQGLQSDTGEVTFTPGVAHKVALSVDPANALSADGYSKAKLTARIQDFNGNLVTTATNVVNFSRTSGDEITVLPTSTSVAAVGGIATLDVTATTGVGMDKYKAESDGLVPSSEVAVLTNITGIGVKVAVQSLSSASVQVGQPMTVKVWVLDAQNPGRLVTNDSGRMIYLNATGGAVVSGPTPTVNGVATFTVTNSTAGDIRLTATGEGVAADTTGKILTVTAGAPDHIVLTATPEALSADGISQGYIAANLVDRYGNPTSGRYMVNLSASSDQFVKLSSMYVNTGGQVSFTAKATPGSTTITGTSGSYAVAPLTISTFHPGLPTKVVVDEVRTVEAGNGLPNQVQVKARIIDENGNPVTSLSTGSNLTAMALRITGSTGTNSTTITMRNNTGLAGYSIYPNGVNLGSSSVTNGIATFVLWNTKAETVTLTPIVFYKGLQLQGDSTTFMTIAGPANKLTVSTSQSTVLSTAPTNVTVSAAVTDVWGNPTSLENESFVFTASTQTYITMPAQSTVTTSGGTASITIQTKSHQIGGVTTITVRSNRTGLSGTATIVLDQPPAKPSLTARDEGGSSTYVSSSEGARLVITAPSRKSGQQVFVYVNGVSVPLYADRNYTTLSEGIPASSTSVIGYIKHADLGSSGTKDIRVMVMTPLGMSPLSDSATLTVQ